MTETEKKIVEILGFDNKSQKEVIKELKERYGVTISTRRLRKYYERIRRRFAEKEINFTILFNSQGNYISYDFNTIKNDNIACRKTAFSILKNAYARDKRIMNDDQITFADYLDRLERNNGGQ